MIAAAVHSPKDLYEMMARDKNPSAEGEEDEGPSDDAALTFNLIAKDPFFVADLPDFTR